MFEILGFPASLWNRYQGIHTRISFTLPPFFFLSFLHEMPFLYSAMSFSLFPYDMGEASPALVNPPNVHRAFSEKLTVGLDL